LHGFEYRFPAVRGIQAGREFYVAMCPMGVIPRLFVPDESVAQPVERSQRVVNPARVPRLAQFLAANSGDYSFGAIVGCIDGPVSFDPVGVDADWDLGRLVFSMSTHLYLTDGQHRWRAIAEAVQLEPELEAEAVPVVLYVDEGVERRQQMFADLNMHAVRPTRSLGILYDHRDPLADLSRTLAERVSLFAGRTEFERTTISNRSGKVFTLSAIYSATGALLDKSGGDPITAPDRDTALQFWSTLAEELPGWTEVVNGSLKPWQLRAQYVHGHGVVLQALGIAGRALIREREDWEALLREGRLATIDWARSNTALWEGRALSGGRVSKASRHVALTTALMKTQLGLSLSAREVELEAEARAVQDEGGAA